MSSEKGQGELMGSIHCTWIFFILITISESYHSPLSLLYSADPLVDLKTHTSTGTIELFFVMILMIPYAYETYVLCLAFYLSRSCLIAPSVCNNDDSAYCQPHSGSAAYTLCIIIYF